MRMFTCRRCHGGSEYHRDSGSGRLPWYCRPCVEDIYVERIKLAMLLIGSGDERSAIRIVKIAVSRWCSMTAASGGICTYIAGRVCKSARTPKTAAALPRSLEERKQISVR